MRERRNDGADRHHVGHQAAVATSTKGKSAIADTMPLSVAAAEHSLMPAAWTKRRTDPLRVKTICLRVGIFGSKI